MDIVMEINKKRFPILINSKDALNKFQEVVDAKHQDYKLDKKKIYLTITPYWICFFDISANIDGKYQHYSGQVALNALSHKIDNQIISLFKYAKPKIIPKLEISQADEVTVEIKDSIIVKEEAQKAILKFLSTKYNVAEENISLSGVEEIYVPVWKTHIDNIKLKFDAVSGKLNNFDELPEKEQTNTEAFKEMLHDLRSPKKLWGYIVSFFAGIFKGIWQVIKFIFKNIKWVLIVFIVCAIIYLIFF
jgi:hypothetical protein